MHKLFAGVIGLVALATSTLTGVAPAVASIEPVLVTPQGSITMAEIGQMDSGTLEARLIAETGTDGRIAVNKSELMRKLAKEGRILLPVAASTHASQVASTIVTPMWSPNDVSITYSKPMYSNAKYLTVCRNWGPYDYSGCAHSSGDGSLSNNQNPNTKYGWADTDGYYEPSNCNSRATFGPISYTFNTPGWIKTGGLAGGAWVVNMWC